MGERPAYVFGANPEKVKEEENREEKPKEEEKEKVGKDKDRFLPKEQNILFKWIPRN